MSPSTNFTENSIPKINAVLRSVMNSHLSNFYRNKYAGSDIGNISSYDDFAKIPFLLKNDFLAVGAKNITFVPDEELVSYSVSSGTTSYNKPSLIPWAKEPAVGGENAAKHGIRKLLLLSSPLAPGFWKNIITPVNGVMYVPGDTNNLKLTAELAKQIKIDGINTSPTILYFFMEHLREAGFDLSSVKWIFLGSEFCSKQKLRYFKTEFPSAAIDFRYAASEVGVCGSRCEYLSKNDDPAIFHPNEDILMEIVDNNGNALEFGHTGKIVVTTLGKMAFPLLRYMTNDMGSIKRSSCPCKAAYELYLGGRADFDVMRFSGVTLSVQVIENSLDSIREYIEPKFQMHVYEEFREGKIMQKLAIHLKLKEKYAENKNDHYFTKIMIENISSALHLSAKSTLKQLVEQNVFLPLEIVYLDSWPKDHPKSKNIISHIE